MIVGIPIYRFTSINQILEARLVNLFMDLILAYRIYNYTIYPK